MKKRQKNILGCLGLVVVATMLGVAVTIPDQKASATTSVVDTIKVRVISAMPDVSITGIVNEGVYASPERKFNVSYENVDTVILTLSYTDMEGNVITKTLDQFYPDYVAGDKDYEIMFVE